MGRPVKGRDAFATIEKTSPEEKAERHSPWREISGTCGVAKTVGVLTQPTGAQGLSANDVLGTRRTLGHVPVATGVLNRATAVSKRTRPGLLGRGSPDEEDRRDAVRRRNS